MRSDYNNKKNTQYYMNNTKPYNVHNNKKPFLCGIKRMGKGVGFERGFEREYGGCIPDEERQFDPRSPDGHSRCTDSFGRERGTESSSQAEAPSDHSTEWGGRVRDVGRGQTTEKQKTRF